MEENDILKSIKFDTFKPIVGKYILTNELLRRKTYKLVKPSKVIPIFNEKYKPNFKIPIYIKSPNYSVSVEDKSYNCDKCNDRIFNDFEEYNKFGDVYIFENITYSCKKKNENF